MPFVVDEQLEARPAELLPPVGVALAYGSAPKKSARPKSSSSVTLSPRQQLSRMNKQLPPGMQVAPPEMMALPPSAAAPPPIGAPRGGARRALSARSRPPQGNSGSVVPALPIMPVPFLRRQSRP